MARRSHENTGIKANHVLLSDSESDELTNEQELISVELISTYSVEYVLDIYFFLSIDVKFV